MKYQFQKLDAAVKRRWVQALRSGDYKQATHQLKIPARHEPDGDEGSYQPLANHDRFCCLGVLCEISDVTFNPKAAEVPIALMERAKLQDDAQQMLIGLNDDRKWSFKKIATWIEKHL